MLFRYMERMHIDYYTARYLTPWGEIERAFVVWSLDDERAKLKK